MVEQWAYQNARAVFTARAVLGPDMAAAEDAAGAAWVKAWERREALRPHHVGSWVAKVASRKAVDELRRRGRHTVSLDAPAPGWQDEGSLSLLEVVPDSGAERPEWLAERRERVRLVREALNGLRPRQRDAVEAVDLRGDSLAEAAEVLGWPLGSLKSSLVRGRARLRVALAGV